MNKLLRIFLFGIVFGLLGVSQSGAAISVLVGTPDELRNDGSIAPSPPAGALNGDILVAQVVTKAAATITVPTGWVEVASASTAQNGVEQRIYYLNLSGAPAGSYSWGIAGNNGNRTAAVIYSVRGAQPADCGSASTVNCAGNRQAGAGNQIIAPNIQSQPPTYPTGSLRMAFFASNDGSATITPARENSATLGAYLRPGSGDTGVGMHGTYYLLTGASNGDQQTAALGGGNFGNIGSTFVIAQAASVPLTCLNDNFNRTSGLGSNWIAALVSGGFTPTITSNRLRLTDAQTNESTGVTFQRLFPGANNRVQVTFRYYGYSGTTPPADGIAITLSDASITPQPGGFGGSLGYATRGGTVPGFAGGWLGVGLDEYGNYSSTESGPLGPASRAQSVAIRGSAPNYNWVAGTATLSPTVANTTGHLYRVTVDSTVAGRSLVTVERDTTGAGTAYSTLISSFNVAMATGQTAIPANLMLTITGSTGSSTNIHELDDVQVCAQTMNPIVAIDHYEFTVGTALTCTPATVTVRACMDAACTTTYSGNASATLLPAGGWGGDAKTFAGSGVQFSLSETVAGTYTLGIVSNSSTPPLKAFTQNAALCSIGGSAYTSNCNLTFSEAGLLYTVPTLTSGVTSAPITITAAKTDDVTKTCAPAFTGSRNIKFWSAYVNPATGSKTLTMNATALSTSSATPSTVPLTFNASGQATFTLTYPDAGQLSLNARYDGSAATNDSGLIMNGSSTFVTVPYRLCVDSPDSNWQCAAGDLTCNKFKKAGEAFNLRVTGKAASGSMTDECAMPTTPNYQQNGIVLTSGLVAPSPGTIGTTNMGSIDITASGTATISNRTQSEVGVFKFTATPPAATSSNNYFSQTVPSGDNNFGRFIPAGFTISAPVITPRGPLACNPASTFTYLGEPLLLGFTLNAVNTSGTVTTNYRGSFARLGLLPSNGLYFGVQDGGTLLNGRLITACDGTGGVCGTWGNGTAAMTAKPTVNRSNNLIPDGLFTTAQFGLKIIGEPDGVGILSPDYNWNMVSPVVNDGLKIGGTTVLRFGRVRMTNAYGSPLLPLPVTAIAQYWDNGAFIKNLDDSCTPLTVPASQALPNLTSAVLAPLYCNGGAGLEGSLTGVAASMNATGKMNAGDAGLKLSKPANTGGGSMTLVLNVPDYLKYNWDGVDQTLPACTSPGDNYMHDDNPRARIRFGAKANNSIIYMREMY